MATLASGDVLRLCIAVVAVAALPAVTASSSTTDCVQHETLCTVLASIKPGESRAVVVAGVYGVGPESRVLYTVGCTKNVQPVTWVEFAPDTAGLDLLRDAAEPGRDVGVVFKGTLYGPRRIAAPAEITDIGRLQLMRSGQRYGHLGSFRTKLVVTDILRVDPVPPGCDTAAVSFWSPPGLSRLPPVLHGDMPSYPELAQSLDIEGDVALRLTVAYGSVTDVVVEAGHPVLANEAVRTVKTWKFGESVQATYVQTSFYFELESRSLTESQNPRLEMELPGWIRIRAVAANW